MHFNENDFVGKTIEKVNLYLVNDQIIDNKNCDRQFVDCGIEFSFSDKSKFSMGFDSENELTSAGMINFSELYLNKNESLLPIEEDFYWQQVIGNRIMSCKTEWNWFEDFDGNKYDIPMMIVFTLDNNFRFALTAMDFDIRDNQISDIYFSNEGWTVIHFDQETIDELLEELEDG